MVLPLVKVDQSLAEQETAQVDMGIGVVERTLLQPFDAKKWAIGMVAVKAPVQPLPIAPL